ncbi:N-acetylglucosamine/diacetylchitobiose ABC transporter substrate-binding protein [Peterkaempfera bronchialis]|uniref:Carbohydrate ABC transporter, N-acetylglucosamine/diacetylchitobiose-binding protein n=1 Tax=Peterkaempfera bronchialis TaxID=2126346 RepID=A0A345T1L6_9ACTN|nr:N-acetylglucosamine/diacetylchitobiose ABC transporter substrate-binding protein [Peterkaempfera bronchialis]AXI79871.1 carbohydrate ABC transporter, N-acetylglucosamine/diacetylchitobiose-binding protein [Peterkaempfera bronchialis]
MGSAAGCNRRGLLKRAAALGLAAVPAAPLLSACALGGAPAAGPARRAPVTPDNPLGVDRAAPLEVVLFDGGFGDGYARDAEALYRTANPGAAVRHTATQDIQPQLQPRFVGGNPPDLIDNSGARQLDLATLAAQGQLLDLTPLLDAPSLDDPAVRVRDTLVAGTAEKGRLGGSALYALNYAFTVYGVYHSRTVLHRHGWQYPATWDGMLRICAAARRKGLAGWTYPGKHPHYLTFTLYPLIAGIGGPQVLRAMDNLEPNAFRHPAVRAAVEAYHELAAKGYVLRGSPGLDHIQAQTAWTEGRALFLPVGSWVENEARATTPADFAMAVAPNPGSRTVWAEAGEPFVVPARGRNTAGALELLRIMLGRRSARNFTRQVSSLSCVRGAADGMRLPPGLRSAADLLAAAGPAVVAPMLPVWYRTLHREQIGGTLGELMAGRIGPDECLTRFQRYADETARDSSLRHPRHA